MLLTIRLCSAIHQSMRRLLNRIRSLENDLSTRSSVVPWLVEERNFQLAARSKLALADRVALDELIESRRHPALFTENDRALWERWTQAFASAAEEIPFGRTLHPMDQWV